MLRTCFVLLTTLILASCASIAPGLVSGHSDMSVSEAEQAGYVVAGPGGVANEGKLEKFYQNFNSGSKDQLTLVHFTDEGDPIFVDLSYNGEQIGYTYDNSWDAFGGQGKGVKKTNCGVITKRTGPYGEAYGTVYVLGKCTDDIGYSDPEKEYFLLFVPRKG
jgi:hypothetical protein